MNIAIKFLISFYIMMYMVVVLLDILLGTPALTLMLSYKGLHAFAFIGAWILCSYSIGEFLDKRILKPRNF